MKIALTAKLTAELTVRRTVTLSRDSARNGNTRNFGQHHCRSLSHEKDLPEKVLERTCIEQLRERRNSTVKAWNFLSLKPSESRRRWINKNRRNPLRRPADTGPSNPVNDPVAG
jgi:hypothetical protein